MLGGGDDRVVNGGVRRASPIPVRLRLNSIKAPGALGGAGQSALKQPLLSPRPRRSSAQGGPVKPNPAFAPDGTQNLIHGESIDAVAEEPTITKTRSRRPKPLLLDAFKNILDNPIRAQGVGDMKEIVPRGMQPGTWSDGFPTPIKQGRSSRTNGATCPRPPPGFILHGDQAPHPTFVQPGHANGREGLKD